MSELLIEQPRDGILLLKLNRPERRNALSLALRSQIAAGIASAATDPAIRVVIITGDDRAFAAGADISELVDAAPLEECFEQLAVVRRALDACPKPVIAAVRGFALGGGCELAMMCDVIVAGRDATFGLPEVRAGIMPGAGGTQRFLRAAGKAKAMRWLLTGDHFDAASAEEMGIVSEVVPDEEVLYRAIEIATSIAERAPRAVAAIKESLRLGANAPLETALAIENRLFQLLFSTADQKEGMRAFLEKRTPVFTGR